MKGFKVERPDAKEFHITLSTRWLYGGIGILVALLLLGLGLTIWGVATQAQSLHLRQQVVLQQEQLKLLESKTKTLENKMKQLDILDKELRQMVTGSEAGTTPQGGGTDADIKTSQAEKETQTGKMTSDGLLHRVYAMEKEAQEHLFSFLTIKNVLENGGLERIKAVQSQFSPLGTDVTQTTPAIWPVKGTITSPFGIRINPVTGVRSMHEGVDIANDYGTPIVATAAGVVTSAGYVDGYGLLVTINHGNGFETRYGHMSGIMVRPGTKVQRGEVVGLMGSTGRSTGPHVHYEVLIQGRHMDPLLFMKVS